MSSPPDPRVLFAAERTLLAWQRTSLALMGFGFVIERFSLFLSALRREPETPGHHVFSLLVGVALILFGAGVALASSIGYRRFVKSLPSQDVSSGYLIGLGPLTNLVVAAAGIALAIYLLVGGLQPLDESSLWIVTAEIAIDGNERFYRQAACFLATFVATHAVRDDCEAPFALE